MVERGGLENRYRVSPYRGFESLTLRHVTLTSGRRLWVRKKPKLVTLAVNDRELEGWPSG